MQRILHLLSSLEIGGKERAVLRLARRAVAAGHSAELLLFDSPYRSNKLDFDPAGLSWSFVKRGSGLDLGFVRSLAARCVAKSIDVLHAHNDTAHVYAGLAARLTGGQFRVVTTFHTRPHHGGPLARFVTRHAARGLNAHAVSEQLAQEVVAAGWLKSCGVIVNGIDTRDFSPLGVVRDVRRQLNIPEDYLVLGHIARFAPIKRHEDLMVALELLQEKRCPVTVICVGQGLCRATIQQRARTLKNVRFVDVVRDMPPFLRSLDGVLLCSEHEATPLALLEGMACGKPVIATAVGGIPTLVAEAGLLVPAGQPRWLAQEIEHFAADAALRKELSSRSLLRAQSFSFDREWEAYLHQYQSEST